MNVLKYIFYYRGEYDVQAGFGWTNGVILDLLATYGDRFGDSLPTSIFFANFRIYFPIFTECTFTSWMKTQMR